MAQLLTRLYAPEEGRIFIDDIDINDIDPAYLRVLVRRSLTLRVKTVAPPTSACFTDCRKCMSCPLLCQVGTITQEPMLMSGTGKSVKRERDMTMRGARCLMLMCSCMPPAVCCAVRDNIAYGKPDATMEEIEAAATLANADT